MNSEGLLASNSWEFTLKHSTVDVTGRSRPGFLGSICTFTKPNPSHEIIQHNIGLVQGVILISHKFMILGIKKKV